MNLTRTLLAIGIVVFLGAVVWWYLDLGKQQARIKLPDYGAVESINVENGITDGWKDFANDRDGYSVQYPHESVSGSPCLDCGQDLSEFGFQKSLSFTSLNGWAHIYTFAGTADEAIEAFKRAATGYTFISTADTEIGGKPGKIVAWKIFSSSRFPRITSNYFVEYAPGQVLYIGGPKEFVSTIQFGR